MPVGFSLIHCNDKALFILHEIKPFLVVGSHQVPFPMCTFETLQKYCSTGSLLLTFSVNFTLSLLKVSFPQTMSFSCIFFCFFFHLYDLSIMSTSTSLTFSEFLVLFSSISLLFPFIESHFALSSARCHL